MKDTTDSSRLEKTWTEDEEEEEEIHMTMSTSDETVNVLDKDAEDPCRSILKDIMFLGQCDDDSNSFDCSALSKDAQWEAAQTEIDNFHVPQTHRWPVVVVDRGDETCPNSHRSGKRAQRNATSKNSLISGCSSSNRLSMKDVDVIFVDQDKDACVYGVEVASSHPNEIGDLYAF